MHQIVVGNLEIKWPDIQADLALLLELVTIVQVGCAVFEQMLLDQVYKTVGNAKF